MACGTVQLFFHFFRFFRSCTNSPGVSLEYHKLNFNSWPPSVQSKTSILGTALKLVCLARLSEAYKSQPGVTLDRLTLKIRSPATAAASRQSLHA